MPLRQRHADPVSPERGPPPFSRRGRAEFFDELARRITDARVLEALKAMAHEYRVTAEQLTAAALIGPFDG
jgi:hypothetical protein